MSNKDFLSQFSGETKKPDSFKEEIRTKVVKEKKPVNKGLLIGVIVGVAVLLIATYFIFLAPKIEMPDFVGKTKNDVAAWVKQQGIETSGIIFNEEYNFDNDEDVILSQDVVAGKKVKNNVKITFVSSKGPDPDEIVAVPDLKTMYKDDIKDWISENKLTKTKITTTYDENVEEDGVISFAFSGCDEETFTRSSTLKITISKGPAPAGTITLEDFEKKTYETVEAWAKNKKITLTKAETFSEKIDEGLVVSQSVPSGKTMKEGETLIVTVSKGKGILVPDLISMKKDDADKWLKDNSVTTNLKGLYSDSSTYIISQSIKANTMASAKDVSNMEVVYRIGDSFYLEDFLGKTSAVGMEYNKVVDICNQKRSSGIDAYVGNWSSSNEEYSYEYKKGVIVSCKYSSYETGKEYYESDRMPLDLRMSVIVSKGKIYKVDVTDIYNSSEFNVKKLVDAITAIGVPFSNNSTDENCQLYVNGEKVVVKDGEESTKYIEIKEVDSLVIGD